MRVALSKFVASQRAAVKTTFICAAVFLSWFSAYGLRKPWGSGLYDGEPTLGLPAKDAIALSQTVGYMLGKWMGTTWIPKLTRRQRLPLLLVMTAAAFVPLVAFALLESTVARCAAMFLNGWPLGWFYGTLYLYLEGRKGAELLGGAISAAYILGSGFSKSVGALLLDIGVQVGSMPAVAGLIFLPPTVFAMVLLDAAPEPSPEEQTTCGTRRPMTTSEQMAFFGRYRKGLVVHTIGYVALTGLKDFRDSFQADIWSEVYDTPMPAAAFSVSELIVASMVIGSFAMLAPIQSAARATLWIDGLMLAGAVVLILSSICSTWLFSVGSTGGVAWSVLCGIGIFSGYVPIGAMYYDRLVGALRCPATAVFMINVSDSAGYIGTIVLVLYKNYFSSRATGEATERAGVTYHAFFTSASLWAGLLLCTGNLFALHYWPTEFRQAVGVDSSQELEVVRPVGELERLTDGGDLRESVSE